MFVDLAKLHAGAADSHTAGEHARAGADRLGRAAMPAGIFGDFGAADVYHGVISAAHTQHATALNNHHEVLGDVGDKARHAGVTFAAMEDRNAAKLSAVACNYDT